MNDDPTPSQETSPTRDKGGAKDGTTRRANLLSERDNTTLRDVSVAQSLIAAHDRYTKLIEPTYATAAEAALDASNRGAVAQAARLVERLNLPAKATVDQIVEGFRANYDRQLEQISAIAKDFHGTAHLASLRATFTESLVAGHLRGSVTKQFTLLDPLATASVTLAAAARLKQPDYQAFTRLRETLSRNYDLTTLIESIQTPWANLNDLVGSAIGIAEAGALFAAARHVDPFDPRISAYMRFELGDYRDKGTDDGQTPQDTSARLEMYTDLGLRNELRDMPGEVLVEAESKIIVRNPAAVILTPFEFHAVFTGPGQDRYLMVCKALRILEKRLRDVISAVMAKQYGPAWIKQKLRPDMRERWQEKQAKDNAQGRPQADLIEYADFTDYSLIITGKPQWEEVFKGIFKQQEDVRESLRRIGPVRNTAFHCREVLEADLIFLTSEGMRLMQALATVPK
ncbi:Swt1 family HEPN domain-containing protein [Massilia sp. KIM]|uniref:Swt1 family HEPN domain-containing protein n=1 Tax=Massilia sp. KIM TaxID=1955422 RepID=UPI00117EACE7|nr:Swt1 family HEPN domain-containing protein [Massilia sp. KIM]